VKARSIALLLIGAIVAAACGPTASAPAATSAGTAVAAATQAATATPRPPKDKVRMPTVVSYELNLPTLVAIAKDYFGEENIELGDLVLGSGGTTRAAVIAKEYDFGLFAFVHIPIARLAGSPWKAILTTHDREIFSLVVRSGLKDKVKKVADLKGMKIGMTSPGAGAWAFANIFVRQAGLDPEKDVELVAVGGDAQVIYTALKTGRVDAFASWEPTTTRVVEDGTAFPLIPIYEAAQHRAAVGADKAAAMLLVTREDVIAAKPDLVKRMVNAHKKGLDFIRGNSAAAIADAVLGNPTTSPQFKGLDRALVVKIVERLKGGFGTGCLSRSGFEAELKLSLDNELIKGPITFKDFGDATWAGECP
jgi:NitT/TauT family transport system substrate-binding protein